MASTRQTTAKVTTTFSNEADIAQFNRGAITTIFTPPTSCYATPTVADSVDGDYYFGHYRDSYYDPSCLPSSTASLAWGLYYYSPAVSCPENFYTASTVRNFMTGYIAETVLNIGADTSVYLCCPTGYTAQATVGYNHICTSEFSGATVMEFFDPTTDLGGIWTKTADLSSTITSFLANEPLIIWVDGVPIWQQSSDRLTTSAPTTSPPPTTGPTSTLLTSTGPPTSTSTSDSGLSTGAKAGIGTGVGIIAIGIALGVIFLLLRRRRQGHPYEVPGSAPTDIVELKELHDTDVRPELYGDNINELPESGQHHPRRGASELLG